MIKYPVSEELDSIYRVKNIHGSEGQKEGEKKKGKDKPSWKKGAGKTDRHTEIGTAFGSAALAGEVPGHLTLLPTAQLTERTQRDTGGTLTHQASPTPLCLVQAAPSTDAARTAPSISHHPPELQEGDGDTGGPPKHTHTHRRTHTKTVGVSPPGARGTPRPSQAFALCSPLPTGLGL